MNFAVRLRSKSKCQKCVISVHSSGSKSIGLVWGWQLHGTEFTFINEQGVDGHPVVCGGH